MTSGCKASHARPLLTEILYEFPAIEAAALYGSVARGDAEAHSDIDLLVLCNGASKKAVFNEVKPALSHEFHRLSLTLYSRREFKFLDRAGSLFLLHLKRESIILFDRNGFLSTLLSRFQPKQSYRADFHESLALLDPLQAKVKNSPNEFHRLSYVYSLFRVFGVYLLAEKEIYEFSKSHMAAHLTREYPHLCNAIAALSGLRILNANFFSGGMHHTPTSYLEDKDSFAAFASALYRLVERPLHVAERSYAEAIAQFREASASFRALNYRLRMWFLLLIYDGLNLYRRNANILPITSFEPNSLEEMTLAPFPPSVTVAADETLNYIRGYSLKYFLGETAKMNAGRASAILENLAREVG